MRRVIRLTSPQPAPLIFELDVLVVGGRLAGVASARAAADGGLKVALIESETYLGYEFGAWQRPWIQWRRESAGLLRDWLPVEHLADWCAEGHHVPLHMDRTKAKLEDRLLERGVQLLYASRPVAYRREGESWLVAFGSKSGLQAVRARFVVDASEHGILACLAGEAPRGPSAKVARRTIEFTGVRGAGVRRHPVPGELGVLNDTVTVYPGAFADDHAYVEVALSVPQAGGRSMENDREVELLCRAASLRVAEHLLQHVPAFAEAKLGLGSMRVMREPVLEVSKALATGAELGRALAAGEISPEACYRVDGHGWRAVPLPAERGPSGEEVTGEVGLSVMSEFAASWPGKTVGVTLGALPLAEQADVLVVGGGTSGAPAACAAAREGVSVALAEMNPRLGGTGTLGGIKAHWMSSPNAFNDEVDERVQAWEARVRYPDVRWEWRRRDAEGNEYLWGEDRSWSIELKQQVLEEMCRQAGVSLHLDSLLFGALVDSGKVVGAALATPYGPCAALGKVTVDATGDGDVAAFAGAEYTYGNARDRQTMFTSLAFFREPGGLGNNFMTPADIGDVFDSTRFIITSRRRRTRPGERLHDHGTYVAPRESRHIHGGTVVTLEDQLRLRRYPDTVAVLFSNWDMKGQWFADIVDFGINPPHLEIEVPYRALVPLQPDQVIVAGKAFSLTHDACAAPRMQRDLILLGGVVGLAAALAVRDGVSPRELDVAKLQRRLVEAGNLPERVLEYAPERPPDVRALVEGLTGDEPLEWQEMGYRERATAVSPVVQLCLASSNEAVPPLREAFARSGGPRRLLLARLLLFHRCADGADVVVEEVERRFAACEALPRRAGNLEWSTGSPEQAIQPEVIFLINNLIRVADRRLLGIMGAIVDRLERMERDYRDVAAGIYDYVRTVAEAAERLTWAEFVPLLERLQELPEVAQSVSPSGLETDPFDERRAFLVLYLARALARCGCKRGLLQLADLISDPRALLAESARKELCWLTGMSHPRDTGRWRDALRDWPEVFPAAPWRREVA